MSSRLQELASTIGVMTEYVNDSISPNPQLVSDDIVAAMSETLGYKCGNAEDIERSIEKAKKRRWLNTLDSIYVVEQDEVHFDVVIPTSQLASPLSFHLKYQNTKVDFVPMFSIVDTEEEYTIGRTTYHKLLVKISGKLEVGYYDLNLQFADENYKSCLAVAPKHCYANEALQQERLWGFAVQLYALHSERNWGIGDFTDLLCMVDLCKRAGADVIGLNPLNVLSHDYPEDASPYGSISRLFLNPIYIDVEAVPEFLAEDIADCHAEIKELCASPLIQYGRVYPLKIRILEKLYARFQKDSQSPRHKAFAEFVKFKAADLEKLAVFQTLSEELHGTYSGGWKNWPAEFHNPQSRTVAEYAKSHADRIGFFKYLQFEADRQFALIKQRVDTTGLEIGLYRDLAVGVSQNSAEVWSDNDVFIKDAGAGAPPDYFFPNGQNWGLGAFNPIVLKERAYEPYIKVLRANMQNSGALRIDHAMGLLRLFVILNQQHKGTYILYNLPDMLNILAIESYLNRCVIVGEAIGVVPEGFIDQLEAKNIASLSVLWSERWDGAGDFKSPYEYAEKSFASVGTHDMPPLKMWWFGSEIAEKFRLGIFSDEASRDQNYKQRELDRSKLLFALDSNGVWPEDKLRQGDYLYGEGYPEGIEEAVNRYASRSRSQVFLSQLEDILHVEKMQNLPGIDRDQHPNWRLKLPVSLEKLEDDVAFVRNIRAIKRER